MMLVDTTVWVDHLRAGVPGLAVALRNGLVGTHPFVIGELACGRIPNRREVLRLLGRLPEAPVASAAEVLAYIEWNDVIGTGVGLVDVHLLVSAKLGGVRLWSRDKRLNAVAARLGLAHEE